MTEVGGAENDPYDTVVQENQLEKSTTVEFQLNDMDFLDFDSAMYVCRWVL